ncbi:hypothetical protein KJ633_04125 [bacterium]|nr:hypothetical protein [bacterium]
MSSTTIFSHDFILANFGLIKKCAGQTGDIADMKMRALMNDRKIALSKA